MRKKTMINDFYISEIQVEIENKCELDCLHCSSSKLRRCSQVDLRYDEFFDFIQKLNTKNHIYLTGGEPLLHSDIINFISKITNNVPFTSVGVFSSGIIKMKDSISINTAHSLKSAGLSDCYISLYHCIPKEHDFITGLQGSYKTTCYSIENFIRAGVDVKAHLVLTKNNINNIDVIVKNFFEIGVSQVRILRMVKTGNAFANWDIVGVPIDLQNSVIKNIITNLHLYNGRVTISGFPIDVPCRPFPLSIRCQAGIGLFYITHDNCIYPCACTKSNNNFLIGNLNNIPLAIERIISYKAKIFNNSCLNPVT